MCSFYLLLLAAAPAHVFHHFLRADQNQEHRPGNSDKSGSKHVEGLEEERDTNKDDEKRNHLMMRTFTGHFTLAVCHIFEKRRMSVTLV